MSTLKAAAVVLTAPGRLELSHLALDAPGPRDAVVDIAWSGVSTGTERLFYDGRMPPFPGMGYPLVPGYEAVGRVAALGSETGGAEGALAVGDMVFAPGARCYQGAAGLFGAAASRLVTPAERLVRLPDGLGEDGVLFALAATAHHALVAAPRRPLGPDAPQTLIIGHGALGRLMARIALALGAPAPTVWETDPARRDGAAGYAVCAPEEAEAAARYALIIDASGAGDQLDAFIQRLSPGGELVLAGFYESRLGFDFAPAFMREARLSIAAEFKPADIQAVRALASAGALDLGGLITHRAAPIAAPEAYRTAFDDPACLKMILDWRAL